jgi:hypothetical protein
MNINHIPGLHSSILFHVTEWRHELFQVGVYVNLADYIAWILINLGYPVLTPFGSEPALTENGKAVRYHHEKDILLFMNETLSHAGYNGEELWVTSRGSSLCAISFIRSAV